MAREITVHVTPADDTNGNMPGHVHLHSANHLETLAASRTLPLTPQTWSSVP